MSIFASLDRTLNPAPTFWQAVDADFDPMAVEPEHAGVMQYAEGDLGLQEAMFVFVKTRLFKLIGLWESPTSIEVADLRWKVADPFFEETEDEPIYGFSLSGPEGLVEFYTQGMDALDGWLVHLSFVCILTGFTDDFEVLEQIGKGSTATVYSARSLDDDQVYAIKRIEKSLLIDSKTALTALATEIEVLRRIKHENILRMYRIYELDLEVCLILEYFPGGDLSTRLHKNRTFPEDVARKLIWKLLDTVDHLHDNMIVHRDLKLDNILLTNSEDESEFRLADFGLCTIDKCEGIQERGGSPGYVAPEILDNRPYNMKVDLFSIGVIMYSLLTGKLPFASPDLRSVLYLNRRCNINYNLPELQTVSVGGLALAKALMSRDPNARPTAKAAKAAYWFSASNTDLGLRAQRKESRGTKTQMPTGPLFYKRSPMTFTENIRDKPEATDAPRAAYLAKLNTARTPAKKPSIASIIS